MGFKFQDEFASHSHSEMKPGPDTTEILHGMVNI